MDRTQAARGIRLVVLAAGLALQACGGGDGGGGTPAAPILDGPSGLTAIPTSATTASLSWTDNSTGEIGFVVERATGAGSNVWDTVASVGANVTTWDDSGLTPSTTYRYRVRASFSSGSSPPSRPASIVTAAGAPAAPSGLTATPTSSTTASLAWTDNSSNESGFEVQAAFAAGGPWTFIGSVAANATAANVTGLTASTTFYFRVRAVGPTGTSAYTTAASVTTPTCDAAATRCVAGDPSKLETCNASGTGFAVSACAATQACTDGACRAMCALTSVPAVPTACVFPIADGVNDGTWYAWFDSRLAVPAYLIAAGAMADATTAAPVRRDASLAWPYYWRFSSTGYAAVNFTMNQFANPSSPSMSIRTRRAMVITTGTPNYYGAAWAGATTLGTVTWGPVSSAWTLQGVLVGSPLNASLNYAGGTNGISISITGTAPVDSLDVNWLTLGVTTP